MFRADGYTHAEGCLGDMQREYADVVSVIDSVTKKSS